MKQLKSQCDMLTVGQEGLLRLPPANDHDAGGEAGEAA